MDILVMGFEFSRIGPLFAESKDEYTIDHFVEHEKSFV